MTELKREGILFCLVGPTGSGKSTLAQHLLKRWPESLRLSISATTREPREGEQDGTHYHFLTRSEFEAKRDAGDFFEWEEVHGNYYGTLRSTLEESIESGVDLLLDIDIRGALSLWKAYPKNTVGVFLLPPSFDEMKQRLTLRGTTDEETLKKRFATAQFEYETLLGMKQEPAGIDYVVVNDDLDEATEALTALVVSERHRRHRLHPSDLKKHCTVEENG